MAESPNEITKRWRAEGRDFRPGDVNAEFRQQGIDSLREREDRVLDAEPGTYPDDLVKQVQDHREAGQWTTQGGSPRSE
jgi:hypothetical protein